MKAIAAMTIDRVIGKDNSLPWPPIKKDMQFFKDMTRNKVLIMGRKTYQSLPKPYLPNRDIIVLSREVNRTYDKFYTDKYCKVCWKSFEETEPSRFPYVGDNTWLCGGGILYSLLLPICTDLYITIILDEYEGNVYMPEFSHIFPEYKLIKEYKDMWIVHYWKPTSLVAAAYREAFDGKLQGTISSKDNPYEITLEKEIVEKKTFQYDLCQSWYRGWSDATTLT